MKAIEVIKKYSREIDRILQEDYVNVLISTYTELVEFPNVDESQIKVRNNLKFFCSKSLLVPVRLLSEAGYELDYKLIDELEIPTDYEEIYDLLKIFLESDIDDSLENACEFIIMFNTFVNLVEPRLSQDSEDV